MKKYDAKKTLAKIKELDLELENVINEKKDSTLLDYVKWYGNFGFGELPLREADILVMCVVSYFEFSAALKDRSEMPLSETLPFFSSGEVPLMITGGDMGNSGIYAAAAESKRFGSLKLKNYVNVLSQEPPVQFSAVSLCSDTGFSVICFRGTDSTIAGWKENFMISFTRTKAQELAEEYVAKYVDGGSDWIVAGHSKGGNLALCAAISLGDEQLANVKHVYLLDGPGLCPEVASVSKLMRIKDKTTRIIPEFDIIGKLFEPEIDDLRIVRSFRRGINQHSLASWMVDHGELSTVPCNAAGSKFLNDLVDNWIRSVDVEKRKTFVNELFDSMRVDGVEDIATVSPEYYGNVLIKLTGKSKQTRQIIGEIPKKLIFDGFLENLGPETGYFTPKQIDLFYMLVIAALGTATLLLSGSLFEAASVLAVGLILVFQVIILIRRLVKERSLSETTRLRMIMVIGIAGALTVLILKPNALNFFGSVILGLTFAVFAFVSFEKIASSRSKFFRILSVSEFAISVLLAIAFFAAPQQIESIVAIVAGILLLLDALARGIRLLFETIRDRTNGKKQY
ncbi:MAG: DUF2974 domain-containing protein [Clostridia bacterium]|nr:DUF2974 domain-containing protein [Clostridia bacterium]